MITNQRADSVNPEVGNSVLLLFKMRKLFTTLCSSLTVQLPTIEIL